MSDLFEAKKQYQPLAARMRPRVLSEYIGQQHILGEGSLLREAVLQDKTGSLILYGPPGSGKTTLARVIAETTKSYFVPMSAISAGKADIMKVVAEAKERLSYYEKKTILFIDEIHRFNKAQQDALLPSVEEGTVTFIGATTENPYFQVNKALLSRARIYQLEPLTKENIKDIIIGALEDKERGLGEYNVQYDEEPLDMLAELCAGDARVALNTVEALVILGESKLDEGDGEPICLTAEGIHEALQKKALRYDRGDDHYDVISAFIKSMRGSDPDAALHYLARMIEAGEDMEFVARRIMIHAAEDVGMADPNALNIAVSAYQALMAIGLPEARIPLAEAVVYIATAPKSNSIVCSIDQALRDVRQGDIGEVPLHLRDAHHSGVVKEFGNGVDYKYPHEFKGGWVEQQYLPDPLKDRVYYKPSPYGREKNIIIPKHLKKK